MALEPSNAVAAQVWVYMWVCAQKMGLRIMSSLKHVRGDETQARSFQRPAHAHPWVTHELCLSTKCCCMYASKG